MLVELIPFTTRKLMSEQLKDRLIVGSHVTGRRGFEIKRRQYQVAQQAYQIAERNRLVTEFTVWVWIWERRFPETH